MAMPPAGGDQPEDKVARVINTISDHKAGQEKALSKATDMLAKSHKVLADTTAKTAQTGAQAAETAKTHQDAVTALATSMNDGLNNLADAHRQSSQALTAALTRKKKATLSNGKTVEIE